MYDPSDRFWYSVKEMPHMSLSVDWKSLQYLAFNLYIECRWLYLKRLNTPFWQMCCAWWQKLTYWTRYINPISCLIFLVSSFVINMLLLIQFLFTCSPTSQKQNWPFYAREEKTETNDPKKMNGHSMCRIQNDAKHCDNFSVVLHTKYLLDSGNIDVNKTMRASYRYALFFVCRNIFIASVCLLSRADGQRDKQYTQDTFAGSHICVLHSIKLPKNEHWHIKGWTMLR